MLGIVTFRCRICWRHRPPEKRQPRETPMQEPRTIDTLLAQYSESHLNHTNEIIHFICVPVIVFTLLGLLWCIHPLVALAMAAASMLYYFKLSRPFALGMLLMAAVML